MVLVDNSWALFLSGGELSLSGEFVLEPPKISWTPYSLGYKYLDHNSRPVPGGLDMLHLVLFHHPLVDRLDGSHLLLPLLLQLLLQGAEAGLKSAVISSSCGHRKKYSWTSIIRPPVIWISRPWSCIVYCLFFIYFHINTNVKCSPNPKSNPNLNPYPIPNQKPNHYPHC